MGKTLPELISLVQSWCAVDQDDDDERLPSTVVSTIIEMVSRDYLRRRESRLGEADDSFTTVVNTPNYNWPASFSKPRKLWYLNNKNQAVVIQFKNKDKFDALYPFTSPIISGATITDNSAFGDPVHFTLWKKQFVLGPAPSSITTIYIDYYSIDGLTRFLDEAWEYLLFASLVKSTEFGVEDSRLPVWVREAEKFELAIDNEDSRQSVVSSISQSVEPG